MLTLDRALTNFIEATGVELAAAVGMVTRNPAALLGEDRFGEIAVGKPANLTVRDRAGRIVQSFIEGRAVLG